jgi:hypothetical protein
MTSVVPHVVSILNCYILHSFFWFGFILTMVCIFGLAPLSTEQIEVLKEWDDMLL